MIKIDFTLTQLESISGLIAGELEDLEDCDDVTNDMLAELDELQELVDKAIEREKL